MDVVLATCSLYPEGESDEHALVSSLADVGLTAHWQVWDDPAADWSAAPVVVRSTWDYTPRREQFLAWTRGVSVLHNPAELIAWNSDKTYLRDLADAGLPIVPTTWAEPGTAIEVPDGEFVVKPSVGAGSRGAGRFAAADVEAARAHAEALQAADRTVMVQPYQAGVDTTGETALVYFDGVFSHSIRKAAMLPAGTVHTVDADVLFVPERITPRAPSEDELAVGAAVVGHLASRSSVPLYARVDLLPTADGPVVIELELVEPSLFLSRSEGAAARLATAIAARLCAA